MRKHDRFDFQEKIEQIKEDFGFDFVGVALVQSAERRFELRWTYAIGNRSERYRRIVLQSGKGIAGHVFKSGKPFLVDNTEKVLGSRDLFNYPIIDVEGLKSFGAIPLYQSNRVQGVLLVGYRSVGELSAEAFAQFRRVIDTQMGPYSSGERIES